MTKTPTIIIFDPKKKFRQSFPNFKNKQLCIYCTTHNHVLMLLNYYSKSIRIIIYCTSFTMSDYESIKTIKQAFIIPEFILISCNYDITTFSEIAKLGIFSIHNISVHEAIIDLDVNEILALKASLGTILKNRLRYVLDKDLFHTYQHFSHSSISLHKKQLSSKPTIPNLLIIEDNIVLNNKICSWLKRYSIKTAAAFNAKEAILLCRKMPFDLIILDLGLPDNTSTDLISQLRFVSNNSPIILLTAYKDYESLLHCMQKGAFEYITKPFNPKFLLKKIHQTLTFSRVRGLPLSKDDLLL